MIYLLDTGPLVSALARAEPQFGRVKNTEASPKMVYDIEFKTRAIKDLKSFPQAQRDQIVAAAEALRHNLAGNVKRLTNFTPEYRLRVGDYRVLFEVEGSNVVVYRVRHRKDAYR